jgi:predicted SAM-dependent methyltransferase
VSAACQIVPDPQHVRLNLGCSDRHIPGFVNVDIVQPCDQQVDLGVFPWPWPESSVDELKAWDFFEHLPEKRITMNEAWRVLKPGGRLDLFVPTTDGRGAFQDPTHKSWWTPNDLFYFCDQWEEWHRFHGAYGITAHFQCVTWNHKEYEHKVWKMRAILQAVK